MGESASTKEPSEETGPSREGWNWDAEYREYCKEAEKRGDPHPWYEKIPNKFKRQRHEPDEDAA